MEQYFALFFGIAGILALIGITCIVTMLVHSVYLAIKNDALSATGDE